MFSKHLYVKVAYSDQAEVTPVKDTNEAVGTFALDKSKKTSRITRRMNIMNNLMTDQGFLDEVK